MTDIATDRGPDKHHQKATSAKSLMLLRCELLVVAKHVVYSDHISTSH